MRRDSFAAGFWCALVVVTLILVAGREAPRQEVLPPVQAPIVPARFIPAEPVPAPEPPPPLVRQEVLFTGNESSRRFHTISCRYASCTNCTARFATRDEAIAAGYRPGGCCHP